jgi:hypothetical protein
MMSHLTTAHAVADYRRRDLLAASEYARNVDIAAASPSQWRPLVVRALALLTLVLGVRA